MRHSFAPAHVTVHPGIPASRHPGSAAGHERRRGLILWSSPGRRRSGSRGRSYNAFFSGSPRPRRIALTRSSRCSGVSPAHGFIRALPDFVFLAAPPIDARS